MSLISLSSHITLAKGSGVFKSSNVHQNHSQSLLAMHFTPEQRNFIWLKKAAKLDKELLFDGGVEGVGFLLEPDEVPLFGCKMNCK